MDAVRFGRALGVGARAAAKTLVTAADAATAENPSAKPTSASASNTPAPGTRPVRPVGAATQTVDPAVVRKAANVAAQTIGRGRDAKEALGRGGKRFGQSALEPVVRLSGVLWLEVSGAFFGIFALGALAGAWRLRGSWHEGRTAREQ